MPFIVDEQDPNKQNANNGVTSQNAVPAGQGNNLVLPNSGGTSASAPSGSQSTSQSAGESQPTSSGSYTNLQNYLNVNADQGQNLADRVGAETRQNIQGGQDALNSGVSQFTQQVNSQAPQVDQGLVSDLKAGDYQNQSVGNDGYSLPHQHYYQAPAPKQYADSLSDAQKKSITDGISQTYKGPNSIEDTGLLQSAYDQASKANSTAQNFGTEAGRFSQLQRMVKDDPGYHQGGQLLDQAILETNPQATQSLSSLQNDAKNLNTQLGVQSQQANQLVNPMRQQIANSATQTKSGVQSAIDQYLKNLNAEASDANTQKSADYRALQNLVGNYASTDWAKSQLPVTNPELADREYQAVFGLGNRMPLNDVLSLKPFTAGTNGIDFTKYVTNPEDATASSIANIGDQSELAALQSLIGGQGDLIDPTKVGTGYGNGPQAYVDNYKMENDLAQKADDYKRLSPGYQFAYSPGGDGIQNLSSLGSLSSKIGQLQNGADLSPYQAQLDAGRRALNAEDAYRDTAGIAIDNSVSQGGPYVGPLSNYASQKASLQSLADYEAQKFQNLNSAATGPAGYLNSANIKNTFEGRPADANDPLIPKVPRDPNSPPPIRKGTPRRGLQ